MTLKKERKLNKVTIKTLKKSDKGEELTYYNSFEDFYKTLRKQKGEKLVQKMRSAKAKFINMTTDEIMDLTRGE
jgi:hypothetical protein